MIKRLTLALVYDTRDKPFAAGIRAVAHRARRLLYGDDVIDIVIEMTPSRESDQVRLSGQVLDCGNPIVTATVRLDGQGGQWVQTTDDDGQFRVAGVPHGLYGLRIEASSYALDVPALVVA